jgi:uncharacterized membrane protein
MGVGISTYLTLYQWHVTASISDPFFGPASSEAVLTSFVSRYLPLPDATLGALAYLVEAVATAVGGGDRSRTTPWLVLLFGVVLLGLALTSLTLVLNQILLVHALCTLCLCSAAISFVTAWLGRDEVVASLRHVRRTRARGASLWIALCSETSAPASAPNTGYGDRSVHG